MGVWTIDFYEKPNGSSPTKEFLDSLPARERVIATNAINQLQTHGLALVRPQVGYLRDHIRELRVDIGRKRCRILHSIFNRDTFVLLQSFTKRAQDVPDVEIDRAIEYKRDYESRHTSQQRR